MSFYETFRPTTFKQMVGREKIISQVQEMIESKDGIPHLLLSGPQGTGKTTFAMALVNAVLGKYTAGNFHEFNGSDDRGIDVVRGPIKQIARRRPIDVDYKIVLIDEADAMTADAQASMKRIIEKYHKQTRFIFTVNHPYKLLPPVISRFTHYKFDKLTVNDIAKYLKRCIKIINAHPKRFTPIKKTDSELIALAKFANGDMRLALGMLEGKNEVDNNIINMKYSDIIKMSDNEKMDMAFKYDADMLFNILWEIIKKEKRWNMLQQMADCSTKLSNSLHKTIFIGNLLVKHFV